MQFASIPYAFAPYPPSLLLPHREQECGGRPDARNERWNAATRQTAHPCVHRPRRCHRSIRHSPHLKRAKFQQKRYGTVGTGTAIRPRRVPTQAALPVALTPGASSADTATVGAPLDADDTGAAIQARRGAASSTVAQMGTHAPSTQRAGMTGGAVHRSPHGFAQERMECAYAPR
jgi:hypothetical protein